MRSLFLSSLLGILGAATACSQAIHFHHVHLNTVDPAAAVDFYLKHFSGEKTRFANADAVWTQKSWLLFNKVKKPPPYPIVSSLYHIGWGGGEMKAEYLRLINIGTTFQTMLTDAVDIFGTGTRDRNFFLYVESPDHALIEVQSTTHRDFSHVHLLADDPVASAEWYEKHFPGMTRRGQPSRTPRAHNGIPTGPAAFLILDNVSFIWFPTGMAKALFGNEWSGRTMFESPRGRPIDHFAFSVDNLDETVARLRSEGVPILQEPRKIPGMRSAFLQGPDRVEIELVEGHPAK